jgi:cellulose synthase (UDP-forming)
MSRPGRGLRPGRVFRRGGKLGLRGLPWGLAWLGIPAGLLCGLTFITMPLEVEQQAVLALAGFLLYALASRIGGRGVTIFLVVVSTLISLRYLHWRLTETLDFATYWQTFFGTGLLLAEVYAVVALLLAYFQTIWPLDRRPVPLPEDPAQWPTVDVFIPTYNEALDVVKPSVYAALAMDWPREKMNVYLLDDGRREEFRRFAEAVGCEYVVRPDNKGAKAGNINHALSMTDGEFIVVFDCDHVATRAFLQLTMGWMLRDRDLAMVQTPHHFYSPDPFERNLASGTRVPNEGLLFYGLVQQGNDMWDATFFCGSCAVIRREALEEVGGVPTQTVTEDCHCSLKMQKRGWRTAYLRLPLAAGLATERLMLHIGQRMRWSRGMVQILRLDNPLTARGLRLPQRLCYFMSMFHFLFPLPRVVFLTSPLAFLLFGQSIIAASPLAIMAYAGPHIVHSVVTASRMAGKVRHSFWSEIYEAVLALYLLPVVLATLLDPRRGKFNVTDKGGTLQDGFFDLRAVGPNMILALVLLAGLLSGLYGLLANPTESLEFQAYALNSVWALICFVVVLAGLAVGRERRQVRERARVRAVLPARIRLPDGQVAEGETQDLSLGGAALSIARPDGLPEEAGIMLELDIGPEWVALPAEVLRWSEERLQLRFTPQGLHDEGNIVRAVLCRADAWLDWDDVRPDRPLRSMAEVAVSIGGLLRGGSQFSLSRRRTAASRPALVMKDAARTPQETAGAARRARGDRARRAAAAVLLGLALLSPAAALAQSAPAPQLAPLPLSLPPSSPPSSSLSLPPSSSPSLPSLASPAASPAPMAASTRTETRTLRQLGLRAPMQLRGTSDLQGVLFGVRGDEVVTGARLTLQGATSPALIPELSQVAVTLNEQFVGVVNPDRQRPTFGPLEMAINPVFFTDLNRLNFRFTGRYTQECNDPLSGLLWSTVSDLSTLQLTLEKLPLRRDLARLPEPFFDPRLPRELLSLPFVLPDAAVGNELIRAAAIASSWFAVQADYRGASFPVSSQIPTRGHAVVVASGGGEVIPGLSLPRMEGPTLSLVPNPNDPHGVLLVVGGSTASEAVTAATALAVGREALSGETALVHAPALPPRAPYDAPRWIRSDRPVRFGELVDPSELQAHGYGPGPLAIPFRTAPDLYTWRNRALPVNLFYRAPPGPITDVAVSRLDVTLNDVYLRSLPLRQAPPSWPFDLVTHLFAGGDRQDARFGLPPYLVFGQNELQLRFDMRPMHRGDCVAIPADVRASVDPDSTIDLSDAHRFTTLPNLSFFTGSGFPFTRLADFSGTAAVLPERPNSLELSSFFTLVGRMAAIVGHPATGLQVTRAGAMSTVADRDLLVIGALGRNPALPQLLQDGPVQLDGNRLSVALPDVLEGFRHLFLGDGGPRQEREQAQALLTSQGEGMGLLIGFESPLSAGKSVVALSGTTPQGMEAMLAALRNQEQVARVQGDLAILAGGRVSGFKLGGSYAVGHLPPHLWPQYYLGGRPELLILLVAAAGLLIAIPSYWVLRRRAALRLRTRTS